VNEMKILLQRTV